MHVAMSEIITCPCGAKIRLPEQTANRAFRCPQCKNGIALTLDAQVLASMPLKPGDSGSSCPICQSPIAAEEPVVTCPACDQIHHRECWAEIGGCGTYGCKQAPALEKGSGHVAAPDRLGRYQEVSGLRRNDQIDRREVPLLPDRVRHRQPAFAGRHASPREAQGNPKGIAQHGRCPVRDQPA